MSMKSSGSNIVQLSAKQRSIAGTLCNWQGIIQKHFHETVEAQTIRFFLTVASKSEPVDLTEINRDLGLSKSALSRNFYKLENGVRGDGGLELLKAVVDYSDRRRMVVELTAKGLEVAKELLDYIPSKSERS